MGGYGRRIGVRRKKSIGCKDDKGDKVASFKRSILRLLFLMIFAAPTKTGVVTLQDQPEVVQKLNHFGGAGRGGELTQCGCNMHAASPSGKCTQK